MNLNPCRHCGGKAVRKKGGKPDTFYVRCKNFDCFSDNGGVRDLILSATKLAADEVWNAHNPK